MALPKSGRFEHPADEGPGKTSDVPDHEPPPLIETFSPLFNDYRGHRLTVKSAFLMTIAALEAGYDVDFGRTQAALGAKFNFGITQFRDARFIRVRNPKGGSKSVYFDGSCPLDTMSAEKFQRVDNKLETKKLLHAAGVLTPFGGAATAANLEILKAFQRKGIGAVIVKPLSGSLSKGVLSNVSLDLAARHVRSLPHTAFLVEQPIPGREFRTYAIDGKLVSAVERIPGYIIGDGRTPLKQLIEAENTLRKRHPEFFTRLIDAKTAAYTMAIDGKSLDWVPALGERVAVSMSSTTNRGTILINATETVPDSVAETTARAIKTLGLRYTAFDIRLNPGGRAFVLEGNGRPAIGPAVFEYRNDSWNPFLPRAILRLMFPKAEWGEKSVRRFEFRALCNTLFGVDAKDSVSARDFVELA